MAGIMVFTSLAEALRAGFQIYDRNSDGYIMRIQTTQGWQMALAKLAIA
jgi:Ca2+-binding EF-hand superfamily protein